MAIVRPLEQTQCMQTAFGLRSGQGQPVIRDTHPHSTEEEKHKETWTPGFSLPPQPQGMIWCPSLLVSVSLFVPGFGWLIGEARLGTLSVPLFCYQILGYGAREEPLSFSDLDSAHISYVPIMLPQQFLESPPNSFYLELQTPQPANFLKSL